MSITVYGFPLSGHSHRAELFLSLLGLEYTSYKMNLKEKEHKSEDFLEKNIFGQIPVLDDNGTIISDSNAILIYLASKYDESHKWLPTDPIELAEVQRFLSLVAGPIAYGPAKARLVNVFGAKLDHPALIEQSHQTLTILNKHLADREWLATKHPTIADIANYTYIAHVPEGDVSLNEYKNITAWLKRIEGLDGFIPMQATSVGLAKEDA